MGWDGLQGYIKQSIYCILKPPYNILLQQIDNQLISAIIDYNHQKVMKKEVAINPPVHIVWAKVKGYPWWPATINVDPSDLVGSQKYRVDFFGETSHSIIAGNMIEEFRAGYEEYSTNKNRKLIQAIKLAQTFEKELKEEQKKINKKEVERPKTPVVEEEVRVEMEVELPEPQSSIHHQVSKNETSEGKKSCDQSDNFRAPLASMRRIRSERKLSQIQDEVYCPYKLNRHKTITKLSRCGSTSNSFVIPYRRYFDQKYQVRIIDILNKIHLGKVNENDISRLLKRINNLDKKHLFNKYIFSGLVQMLRMLEEKSDDSTSSLALIQQLRLKLQQLKGEIVMSLESTAEIEEEVVEGNSEAGEEDTPTDILEELAVADRRKAFVQNIYRIIKTKKKENEGETGRKESLRILSIFERLLQRKKMGRVKELLRDLMENQVNTESFERELGEEEEEESIKN